MTKAIFCVIIPLIFNFNAIFMGEYRQQKQEKNIPTDTGGGKIKSEQDRVKITKVYDEDGDILGYISTNGDFVDNPNNKNFKSIF